MLQLDEVLLKEAWLKRPYRRSSAAKKQYVITFQYNAHIRDKILVPF